VKKKKKKGTRVIGAGVFNCGAPSDWKSPSEKRSNRGAIEGEGKKEKKERV